MLTYVVDNQSIGEVDSQAFGAVQQGATNAQFLLKNVGTNSINYRFQWLNAGVWTDLGANGTVYNNTLIHNQVVPVTITALPPQIRLICNASGGSVLMFSASRYFDWATGGFVPLLAA